MTAAWVDRCREVVRPHLGARTVAVGTGPHPLHSCSRQNCPEGARIKEEEGPGSGIRHSCLAVTADSSTEVLKRKEAAADSPREIKWPKWVGAGQGDRQFLLTELVQRPETKSPLEASSGLLRPLGPCFKAF